MNILIVGDSEVGAIAPHIPEVKTPDQNVETDFLVGSSIQFWANGGLLAALSRHAKPNLVIVFLGTNNVVAPPPASDVSNILSTIASQGAQAIWVGPTSVQGKTWPINATLRSMVPNYVDTEALGIPLRDGIHPTSAGASQWLRDVWAAIPGVVLPTNPRNVYQELSWGLAMTVLAGLAVGAAGYAAFSVKPRHAYTLR